MNRLWDQMTDRPFKRRQWQKLRPTTAQKDASYVLDQIHKGKDWDLDRRIAARSEQRNRKAAQRDAFQLLRKHGMLG